jgi:hypothetical protein
VGRQVDLGEGSAGIEEAMYPGVKSAASAGELMASTAAVETLFVFFGITVSSSANWNRGLRSTPSNLRSRKSSLQEAAKPLALVAGKQRQHKLLSATEHQGFAYPPETF